MNDNNSYMGGECMENQDCFICSKHRGQIKIPGGVIYENDLIYVGHIGIEDNNQNYLGHIMIDLKRHVKGIDEMTDEEAKVMGLMSKHIALGLKRCFDVEHVYTHVYGDNVPHLHIHIIPRYRNAPETYWGDNTKLWCGAPRGGENEVEEVCNTLREFLHKSNFKSGSCL